jgi:hypothetical protein
LSVFYTIPWFLIYGSPCSEKGGLGSAPVSPRRKLRGRGYHEVIFGILY